MKTLLTFLLLVAGLMATSTFAGDAAKGKATFEKKGCWQCHGYEGQGGAAGPRLANTQLPEEALISFVHNTNAAMPPFSEKLISDAELSDIYAYVQSKPKPADPKTIPLLNLK